MSQTVYAHAGGSSWTSSASFRTVISTWSGRRSGRRASSCRRTSSSSSRWPSSRTTATSSSTGTDFTNLHFGRKKLYGKYFSLEFCTKFCQKLTDISFPDYSWILSHFKAKYIWHYKFGFNQVRF
jgi:hypothetical protein